MAYYSLEQLYRVWIKTNGYCTYCNYKLVFKNRLPGQRGAWHIDHSNPIDNGGSDSIRNLVPACVDCNLTKSNQTAAGFRRRVYNHNEKRCAYCEKMLKYSEYSVGVWKIRRVKRYRRDIVHIDQLLLVCEQCDGV